MSERESGGSVSGDWPLLREIQERLTPEEIEEWTESDLCLSQLRFVADHHPALNEVLEDAFGGDNAAMCNWLNAPNSHLEGNSPWDMISRGRSDLAIMALNADFPVRN